MAETSPNLGLPYLVAGQAQKYLPVNEAFERLDALFMLAALSRTTSSPPASPAEGDRYIVPASGAGAWAGQATAIAIWRNGGWEFVAPQIGWRAWISDEGGEAVFDNGVWSTLTAGGGGGGGALSVLAFEHAFSAGAVNDTIGTIPAGATVFGVTARVVQAVAGVAGWSLGVADATTRYAAGVSPALNATVAAPTGAPLAYANATPLRLTAEGGSFTGGRVALEVHYLELSVPAAV